MNSILPQNSICSPWYTDYHTMSFHIVLINPNMHRTSNAPVTVWQCYFTMVNPWFNISLILLRTESKIDASTFITELTVIPSFSNKIFNNHNAKFQKTCTGFILWSYYDLYYKDIHHIRGPFYQCELTDNYALIITCSHLFMWDVITLACHYSNHGLIKSTLRLGHGWVIESYHYIIM